MHNLAVCPNSRASGHKGHNPPILPVQNIISKSLSILIAIFQVNLGWPVLLKLRMTEMVVTTGARRRTCKAAIKSSPPTNRHTALKARCPSCRPINNVKAQKGKYHIPQTLSPQAHLVVSQLCLWPLKAPGYLGTGLPCLSSTIQRQYPNSTQSLCSNNSDTNYRRIHYARLLVSST